MPSQSDNDAEREARITEMLRKIKETRECVERLAAEGRRRAGETDSAPDEPTNDSDDSR